MFQRWAEAHNLQSYGHVGTSLNERVSRPIQYALRAYVHMYTYAHVTELTILADP